MYRTRLPMVPATARALLIRRVKCDEAKPSCKRCTSTGRRCDGYEFLPQDATASSRSTSLLPPQAPPRVTFQHLYQPNSISKPFQGTTQERRIFHRFQYCTVPAFTGGSESGFWTKLVLRVGQDEPVIRNAIIALGTLHEDYQIRCGQYSPRLLKEDSYQDALKLYGKAVHQLHQRINVYSPTNAKLAIIASILFACFEVLRRDNMTAVFHYQTGMKALIREMERSKDGSSSLTPYSSGQPSKAIFQETPQSDMDEMLRVFARYDIQACTFSKDEAWPLSTHVDPVPLVLPTNLSLDQVRNHLDNLLVSVYQLVKSDLRMFRYWPADSVPMQWKLQRQDAIGIFDSWTPALEEFFQSQATQLSDADSRSLLGLRLQIKTAVIMLKTCIDSGPETTFDAFEDDFEDMVSKVEQMTAALGMPEAGPLDVDHIPFTMELGIIHPLFFVACKCRNWDIRRRAIAQLRRSGKEGVWEGPIMAVLARRIMVLEEEGLAYGDVVPEANRFHEIKKNVEYDNRSIRFDATRATDATCQYFSRFGETVAF
ncbi:hypothetical protein ABEF95_012124 [Exophiala dermatitidis]|uniref:Zn(2)-C6 fungal-type domain-containing protein n=1 Tax=Exophiala dermatitidis (strain ATCC 34100 / CBS 525.76 / NIH/UT8656) TaxID=858893 RepID=H6BWB1_EXODN